MLDMSVKEMFFDMPRVVNAIDKGKRDAMIKFGAYVRTNAQHRIRSAKGPSSPGEAPHSHVGTLKRQIFFSYNEGTQSVVIGPTPIKSVGVVPPALEYGGPMIGARSSYQVTRKIGDGGEIRIGDDAMLSATTKINPRGVAVTYAKLKTQAMVDRANAINAQLYGRPGNALTIKPRPFMGPSFEEEKTNPKLVALLADIIK